VNGAPRAWPVRLTAAAEGDFRQILAWTSARFGEKRAGSYGETLSAALRALTAGPTIAGVRARSDIGKGMYTLHVARQGRKGRHFVVFRVGRESDHEVIEVLRLLHDSMDLQRHLPSDDEPD
jgi:toxin ParE1/3/4